MIVWEILVDQFLKYSDCLTGTRNHAVTFKSSFIPRFFDARFQQVVLICLVVEQVFVFSLLANSFYCTLYELGVG